MNIGGRTLTNETRGGVLATETRWARDPLTRFFGLMGRGGLGVGEALVFPGTKGIHTHFMRFAIDVVFYDRDGVVVEVVQAMKPWRFSAYHRKATGVIELPAGTLKVSGTGVGDRLGFTE